MRKLILATTAAMAFSGCYKASIHLKAPQPTVPSTSVDNKMHMSLIGIFELSAPVDLEKACPGGTAVIEEKVSFVGGIVNAILGTYIPVLRVMNPTAMCGAPMSEAETETETETE